MKNTEAPVVIEESFATSIDSVWEAITNPELMRQWFFENIDAFAPTVGSLSQFVVTVEDRTFTHLWKVTEVIPGQKISYDWKYKEYPGDAFVTFQLIPHENEVKLKLTMEVVESFPDDVPEFTRESCEGGWNYFIRERLKEFLA